MRRSNQSAAEEQAKRTETGHQQTEIPPAVLRRQHAEQRPQQGDRDDQPIGPAEQRNDRRDHEDERDDADKDREEIEHGDKMAA